MNGSLEIIVTDFDGNEHSDGYPFEGMQTLTEPIIEVGGEPVTELTVIAPPKGAAYAWEAKTNHAQSVRLVYWIDPA